MTSSTFPGLGLSEPLLRALVEQQFHTPTPIQAGAIPALLAGRDLLGVAQTGTGKTAAFGLPLLQALAADNVRAAPFGTRALILAPTRELAQQIDDSLRRFAANLRLRSVTILGGVSRFRQVQQMRRGTDIVVGTPGRVCDLMATGELRLGSVIQFVLDEADRMLDLGFIRDIRRIEAALPAQRQSALFSATMPKEVAGLAESLLRDPVRVSIAPVAATTPKIEQCVHFVRQPDKRPLLIDLLGDPGMQRVIVFTRTKHGADRVAEGLEQAGQSVSAIHGNKSQPQRERALDRFRNGRARVLVATDIAARGIDVTGISHVVNYDIPVEPESYVHRIGRTARAGASGVAISFCDPAEHGALRAIERCTGAAIPVAGGTPPEAPAKRSGKPADKSAGKPARSRRQRRHRGGMRAAA
ncbi:MAG TPA: DEAD/DEAH box helicase [Acetobacteraceae bacterium]|nr:DEAD/DEAH box helicase [Acetobacteraceae bacterium]